MATRHGVRSSVQTDTLGQPMGGQALRSCYGAEDGRWSNTPRTRNATQQCEKEAWRRDGMKSLV